MDSWTKLRVFLFDKIHDWWAPEDTARKLGTDENMEDADEQFLEKQTMLLADLPDDSIVHLIWLTNLVVNKKISTLDKEDMLDWPVSGFFLEEDGKLSVFHER